MSATRKKGEEEKKMPLDGPITRSKRRSDGVDEKVSTKGKADEKEVNLDKSITRIKRESKSLTTQVPEKKSSDKRKGASSKSEVGSSKRIQDGEKEINLDGPATRSKAKIEAPVEKVDKKPVTSVTAKKKTDHSLNKSEESKERNSAKSQDGDKSGTENEIQKDNDFKDNEITCRKRSIKDSEQDNVATSKKTEEVSEEVASKKRKVEEDENISPAVSAVNQEDEKSNTDNDSNQTKISAANEEQKRSVKQGKEIKGDATDSGDEIQSDEDYVPSSGSDEESDGDDGEEAMEVQVVIDEKTGEMVAYTRDKTGMYIICHTSNSRKNLLFWNLCVCHFEFVCS